MTEKKSNSHRLTAKQQRFVEEYLVDLSAAAAARRAGYSKKTAGVIGPENLQKPGIAAAISEALAERSSRTEVTADRVVMELARIGFADLRGVFTEGGFLKSPVDWDDALGHSISSVEVITRPNGLVDEDGNPEIERVHKFRLWDKNSALEKLAKHLGMYMERPDSDLGFGAELRIVRATKD